MTEKAFAVTDYLKFRADLRGFDLLLIEQIIRYGSEMWKRNESLWQASMAINW